MAQLQTLDGQLLKTDNGLANSPDCCCGETCDNCSGTTPQQLSAVFTGIGGSCTGGTCTDLNTTFILDISTPFLEGDCEWRHVLDPVECTGDDALKFIDLILHPTGGSQYDIDILIWSDEQNDNFLRWSSAVESKPDCDGWPTGLTFIAINDGGACTVSGSTATVTAL